jgi:hypothetical protein
MGADNHQAVRRILTEQVITPPQAIEVVEPLLGHTPNKTTIYRWMWHGVGGVKLEHIKVGSRVLTSVEAITRFIEARSQ